MIELPTNLKNQDDGAGVTGSKIDAKHFNSLNEELNNVLDKYGVDHEGETSPDNNQIANILANQVSALPFGKMLRIRGVDIEIDFNGTGTTPTNIEGSNKFENVTSTDDIDWIPDFLGRRPTNVMVYLVGGGGAGGMSKVDTVNGEWLRTTNHDGSSFGDEVYAPVHHGQSGHLAAFMLNLDDNYTANGNSYAYHLDSGAGGSHTTFPADNHYDEGENGEKTYFRDSTNSKNLMYGQGGKGGAAGSGVREYDPPYSGFHSDFKPKMLYFQRGIACPFPIPVVSGHKNHNPMWGYFSVGLGGSAIVRRVQSGTAYYSTSANERDGKDGGAVLMF